MDETLVEGTNEEPSFGCGLGDELRLEPSHSVTAAARAGWSRR